MLLLLFQVFGIHLPHEKQEKDPRIVLNYRQNYERFVRMRQEMQLRFGFNASHLEVNA